MKKLISLTLVFAICFMLVPVINVYAEEQAPMSMLHTEGNKIVNEEGEQITLRGTNLGGWLMQEGWMTPL